MKIVNPGAVARDVPLLLDTHVWILAASGDVEQVGRGTLDLINRAAEESQLFASAASVWEIAAQAAKGVIRIGADFHAWIVEQQQPPGVRLLTITAALAIDSEQLPTWIRRADSREHRNASDRFLVATARQRNAVLVSRDSIILDYAEEGHLTVLDARA